MKTYKFTIWGDKWASDYIVQATNWPTATARALKAWRKKDGKGSRTESINIKGLKVNGI